MASPLAAEGEPLPPPAIYHENCTQCGRKLVFFRAPKVSVDTEQRSRERILRGLCAQCDHPPRRVGVIEDGPLPMCELCGKHEAEVGPYWGRRGRPDGSKAHGWLCRGCWLVWHVGGRSCAIRRKPDLPALDKAEREADLKEREWAASIRRLFRMVESLSPARAPHPTVPVWNRGLGEWFHSILDPEITGVIHELRRAMWSLQVKSSRARSEISSIRWDRKMIDKVTFDLDDPFEDEEFMRRVLEGDGA